MKRNLAKNNKQNLKATSKKYYLNNEINLHVLYDNIDSK